MARRVGKLVLRDVDDLRVFSREVLHMQFEQSPAFAGRHTLQVRPGPRCPAELL